jgi:NADH-quinone oxidoreductase subunit E
MFSTEPKGAHDVYVCTNISCSLRGADRIYEAMLAAVGDDPDFHLQSFECLGACDIAPMASVDGEYVGPLVEADCTLIVEDVKAGRPVLRDKQLRRRKAARTQPPVTGDPASGPTGSANDVRGDAGRGAGRETREM